MGWRKVGWLLSQELLFKFTFLIVTCFNDWQVIDVDVVDALENLSNQIVNYFLNKFRMNQFVKYSERIKARESLKRTYDPFVNNVRV